MKFKTYHLLFLIPILIGINFIDNKYLYNNLVVLTITITLSSLILFKNFPFMAKTLHTRPIYYEDLEDDDEIDPEMITKFQRIFTNVISLLLSIVMAILFDFWIFKQDEKNLTWRERLGISGGLLSIYWKVQSYAGSFLLSILINMKEKKQDNIKPTPLASKGNIQMTSIGNQVSVNI